MAPPPTLSPVTGHAVPPHYIHSSGPHFRTTDGRTILLRGINLSSSAKTPQGQPGDRLDGFWEHAKDGDMSFVGRVLDLDKADEHLERLKGWGFNCLRYVITWESIEHAGPGKYDQEYIDYTVALLRKCKEHGFLVYIDPHQDLWSRFSGGDGAPYWTLLACGLDPENFTKTSASYIQCEWPTPDAPDPASYPDMIWATNYSHLACQTLFTMWFAGRDYAPKCVINGVNIQDFLQSHFFDAMRQLGNAVRDAGDLLDDCVIGWDSMNEPNAGFLGTENLAEYGKETVLRVGPMPKPFEGLRLGMGEAVEVENYKFGSLGPKRDGSVTIDPQGKRAWLNAEAECNGSPYGWVRGPDWELGTCIWAQHGVWDPETSELLQPDYFDIYRGDKSASRPIEFGADYWLQHWRAWAPVVRGFHPEAIHFIHPPVFQVPPKIDGPEIADRAAFSSHFYDGLTLVTKHWNWFNADALGILRGKYASVILGVKVGESAIRKCMREQLGMLRQDTFDSMGQFPTMMGEIGVPFDLDQKKAYRDGDYSAQVRALDASLNACDGSNALNYSIWTYCPDNSHEWGDQWNGEDLSVWSADDKERMLHYRASTSQVDLVGRISNNRNRANSKASSLSSTPFGSVNNSVTRLNVLGDDKSSLRPPTTFSPLASSTSTLASSIATPPPAPARPLYKSTGSFGSNSSDPYQPINQNDGSRALSAFCRPFPVKTVGTPVDINFDIRSSKFSLLVRVDASDVADTTLPTEIYVPLVHYAAYPSRISQLVQDDIDEEEEAAMLEDTALGGYSNDDGKKTTISLSLPDERREEDPRKLALKVKVSDGRWELQDQKLLWYYPRPSKGSITVKIEFEREKGAVPTWVSEWVGWSKKTENAYAHNRHGTNRFSALHRSVTPLLRVLFVLFVVFVTLRWVRS